MSADVSMYTKNIYFPCYEVESVMIELIVLVFTPSLSYVHLICYHCFFVCFFQIKNINSDLVGFRKCNGLS